MPIPLLAAGLIAGGAGAIGAYFGWKSRDEEVNALKGQISELQNQVRRLQDVIEEQQQQITILKKKYEAAHILAFIQRKNYADEMKKSVILILFEKEKSRILVKACSDANSLSLEEKEFLTISNKTSRNDEDREFCLNYIYKKYKNEINNVAIRQSDLQQSISQIIEMTNRQSNRLREING